MRRILILAALAMPGCAFIREHLVRIDGAGQSATDPDLIIIPEGGSVVLSADGSLLTVYDAFGEVVWQGDPR